MWNPAVLFAVCLLREVRSSGMNIILDLLFVSITGLMVGNEFAVAAFVHPAISSLPTRAHVAAAASIAPLLGRVMPFWYGLGLLALLAELFLHRVDPHAFRLLASAAAFWAATIVLTLILLVPQNNRVARADASHPIPAGKQTARNGTPSTAFA